MGEEEIPFELTDTDRENLLAGDERFTPISWEELKQTIADNNLSILKRKPSDLQRYIVWTRQTNAKYGNLTNFLCQERLQWTPLPSSSSASSKTGPIFECKKETPFAAQEDYQILRNDWPYGLEEGIVHLVVWLKTRIPVQEPDGYLLPESEAMIETFVQSTFVEGLRGKGIDPEDKVVWFKNWVSLQSVRGLDHLHVLVRDVPEEVVEEWTRRYGS